MFGHNRSKALQNFENRLVELGFARVALQNFLIHSFNFFIDLCHDASLEIKMRADMNNKYAHRAACAHFGSRFRAIVSQCLVIVQTSPTN
jgi:hypothetical protein